MTNQFTHIVITPKPANLDEDFDKNMIESARQEKIARAAPVLLEALNRANRLLAELTFSSWIKREDSSVDILNRIKATHEISYQAIAKAEGKPSHE